jgi:hypothetical protein
MHAHQDERLTTCLINLQDIMREMHDKSTAGGDPAWIYDYTYRLKEVIARLEAIAKEADNNPTHRSYP